jgi:hypothetical protein
VYNLLDVFLSIFDQVYRCSVTFDQSSSRSHTLEKKLHGVMHEDKCPDRVLICKQRALRKQICQLKRFVRELEKPATGKWLANAGALRTGFAAWPMNDFDHNELAVIVSDDANVTDVVRPGVFDNRVEDGLSEFAGAISTIEEIQGHLARHCSVVDVVLVYYWLVECAGGVSVIAGWEILDQAEDWNQ